MSGKAVIKAAQVRPQAFPLPDKSRWATHPTLSGATGESEAPSGS